MTRLIELPGYLGMLLVLIGYALTNNWLMLAGGILLTADAARRRAWPFVVLNVVWSAIAIMMLV